MADSGDQKRHSILKLALFVGFGDSSAAAADQQAKSRPPAPARSPRSFAAGDGAVGLAIVAAMGAAAAEESARSEPIPIGAVVTKPGLRAAAAPKTGEGVELSESYTCVISHLGGNRVKKKIYFGDGDDDGLLLEPPPPPPLPLPPPPEPAEPPFVVAEFLRRCFLCKKKLDGLDIYMYRGEKAFCSEECRCRQMLLDELGEKFGTGALKTYECSSSPCSSLLVKAGVAAA